MQIKPRKDFEALWALRALVKGVEIDPDIEQETGLSLESLKDLAQRMKSCKFGVLFFGMGLSMTRGKHHNVEAALSLAADLNAYTRFYAKPMRGHGNVTGADNVVAWQTGYPFGVSLGRGYPRFNPGEFTTSDTLARKEADAALIVASDPMGNFSQPARDHLASIPYVALDPKESPTTGPPPWRSPRPPTASTRRARCTAWTTFPSTCGPRSSRGTPRTRRSSRPSRSASASCRRRPDSSSRAVPGLPGAV